jgi:phosphatidylinositol alpha-1,6-mannosyltransferase
MKVLTITIEFPPETGGIENYIYNLVKRIPNSIVLAPDVSGCKNFDEHENFAILRRKILYHRQHWLFKDKFYANSAGYMATTAALMWHSWKIIKKEKPDIILCSESVPVGLVLGILNTTNKIPYVVFTYGKDVLFLQHLPFVKLLLKNTYKNASEVITISEYTRNLIIDIEPERTNIKKIHPCVDSEFFKPMDVSSIQNKYGFCDKKIILTIGRLVERKGYDMVIKSLPEVIDEIPDVVYLIAGRGPCEDYLKELVEELNLEKYVHFMGYIPGSELPYYYNLCDVFIMPSRTEKGDPEGFGIVYIEANACCKPVIGSRAGGIPDAVIDGKTGILVDPLDTKDIAHAIIELLSNEKKANDMAYAGLLRVKQELNWDNAADKLKGIIKDCLERLPSKTK